MNEGNMKKIWIVIACVVVLGLIGGGVWYYLDSNQSLKIISAKVALDRNSITLKLNNGKERIIKPNAESISSEEKIRIDESSNSDFILLAGYSNISSDGNKYAYTVEYPDDRQGFIHIYDLQGKVDKELGSSISEGSFIVKWVPEQSQYLLAESIGDSGDISLLNIYDTVNDRKIFDKSILSYAFSPDNDLIAYSKVNRIDYPCKDLENNRYYNTGMEAIGFTQKTDICDKSDVMPVITTDIEIIETSNWEIKLLSAGSLDFNYYLNYELNIWANDKTINVIRQDLKSYNVNNDGEEKYQIKID